MLASVFVSPGAGAFVIIGVVLPEFHFAFKVDVMKKYCGLAFAFVLAFGISGCGDGGNSSIVENADQTAIEAYQAAEAEEQARLSGEMEENK